MVLAPALNRASDTEQLQVRYKLTPLTTFVVAAQGVQDRFEFEPVRDADSIRVLPGFEFKPFALISGTVAVGYRWFNPQDRVLPAYQGIIAAVDAKYSISATQSPSSSTAISPTRTRRPSRIRADGLGLTATERLTTTWDLSAGRLAVARLSAVCVDRRQHGPRSRGPWPPAWPASVTASHIRSGLLRRHLLRPHLPGRFDAQLQRAPLRLLYQLRTTAMKTYLLGLLTLVFAFAGVAGRAAAQTDYLIGPQDVLTVTVFGEADLSGKYTVEQDGTFTFPLIGRVHAGGVTLRAFEQDLKAKLADGFLRNPQVTVVVDTAAASASSSWAKCVHRANTSDLAT